MKTLTELHYEKQIIHSIAERDCSAQKRAEYFSEFYKYGSAYFEEVCDALFFLSTGEKKGTLYLTPAGKPYISHQQKGRFDKGLFSGEELPPFCGDLCSQLTFFICRLSRKNCGSFVLSNVQC